MRGRKPKEKGKGIEKNAEQLLLHSSWVDSGENEVKFTESEEEYVDGGRLLEITPMKEVVGQDEMEVVRHGGMEGLRHEDMKAGRRGREAGRRGREDRGGVKEEGVGHEDEEEEVVRVEGGVGRDRVRCRVVVDPLATHDRRGNPPHNIRYTN